MRAVVQPAQDSMRLKAVSQGKLIMFACRCQQQQAGAAHTTMRPAGVKFQQCAPEGIAFWLADHPQHRVGGLKAAADVNRQL